MNKIFAVLCIIGCTLAEEKATTPDAAASRKLKTRQVSTVYHGLDYVDPVHPVNYVHEPHVVGAPVHYLEPTVVSFSAAQPAAHLLHPVDQYSVHSPSIHPVYVPTAGYGQSFAYGVQAIGTGIHSSPVSAATSSVSFTPGRSQQAGSTSGFSQTGSLSGFAQGVQQSGFTQDSQQSAVGQGTQQSGAYPQVAQQSASQQSVSQTEGQTGSLQSFVQQSTAQAESQQSGASQGMQVSGDSQSSTQQAGYRFGFLQSGFGQDQQVGIVRTPTAQTSQSQVTFGQQGVANDQGSQQSGYVASQQSGSGSSQQSSGGYSQSAVPSTVAGARQNTQSGSSQAGSQQSTGNVFPASTVAFSSPAFGVSPGSQSVRLIQPYNLSPSYAIHGFRNFQSGSTGGSAASSVPVSQGTFGGSVQGSSSGSSQQSVQSGSGSQFDSTSSQVSGSQSDPQTSFRFGSGNSGSSGIQYSYTSQQSAGQPATVRSGASSSSSQSSSSQGSSSGLSAYSSFYPSGVASSDSSSASVQTSQQSPAILRMSNDFNFDGSFTYGFESENGISSSAAGALRPLDRDHAAQTIAGSYSYTAPDGTPISTNYYADETGFHAQGAHLPTPPPLPEYVARALQVLPQQAGAEQPAVESN